MHSQIPFDQYQRYSMIRSIVHDLKESSRRDRLRILDVGGFFRAASGEVRYPLPEVVPDEAVVVVDLAQFGRTDEDDQTPYVCASGSDLPFPDEAFDVVVSCDTLEHIPGSGRPGFIRELARVSNDCVVIAAPMRGQTTELAEGVVSKYVQLILGSPQPQLAEHAMYRLPGHQDVTRLLEQAGLTVASFPCEDVYGWMFMMVAKHYLLAIPNAAELHNLIDAFYCASFPQGPRAETDAEHSYRRVFVAAKTANSHVITRTNQTIQAIDQDAGSRASTYPGSRGVIASTLTQLFVAAALKEKAVDSGERIDVAVDDGRLTVGALREGRTIGQSFVSHRPNLCRVDLLLATYRRINQGVVRLRLLERSPIGPELAVVDLNAAEVLDNKWCSFRFPPQLQSQNRAFYFELTHRSSDDENFITAYYEPNSNLDGLQWFDSGAIAKGHLAFRTYYVSPSLDEELLARHQSDLDLIDRLSAENEKLKSDLHHELARIADSHARKIEKRECEKTRPIDANHAELDASRKDFEANQASERERGWSAYERRLNDILTALRRILLIIRGR